MHIRFIDKNALRTARPPSSSSDHEAGELCRASVTSVLAALSTNRISTDRTMGDEAIEFRVAAQAWRSAHRSKMPTSIRYAYSNMLSR